MLNWLDALIEYLFNQEPDPILVITTYLIMCIVIYYSPSVEGV